jgi:hypothetical protein
LLIEEEKERCSEIVASAKEIIDAIDTPEAANDAVLALGKLEEALTSKTEARALFLAKIAQMGYKKEKGQYVCAS